MSPPMSPLCPLLCPPPGDVQDRGIWTIDFRLRVIE